MSTWTYRRPFGPRQEVSPGDQPRRWRRCMVRSGVTVRMRNAGWQDGAEAVANWRPHGRLQAKRPDPDEEPGLRENTSVERRFPPRNNIAPRSHRGRRLQSVKQSAGGMNNQTIPLGRSRGRPGASLGTSAGPQDHGMHGDRRGVQSSFATGCHDTRVHRFSPVCTGIPRIGHNAENPIKQGVFGAC